MAAIHQKVFLHLSMEWLKLQTSNFERSLDTMCAIGKNAKLIKGPELYRSSYLLVKFRIRIHFWYELMMSVVWWT